MAALFHARKSTVETTGTDNSLPKHPNALIFSDAAKYAPR
jgi:hypothetical protein